MQVIKLENVNFSYDGKYNAVNNFSLSVNEGEFVALLGANGSGKSTVSKLINALLVPNSGSVTVFDKSTADKENLFEILNIFKHYIRKNKA